MLETPSKKKSLEYSENIYIAPIFAEPAVVSFRSNKNLLQVLRGNIIENNKVKKNEHMLNLVNAHHVNPKEANYVANKLKVHLHFLVILTAEGPSQSKLQKLTSSLFNAMSTLKDTPFNIRLN